MCMLQYEWNVKGEYKLKHCTILLLDSCKQEREWWLLEAGERACGDILMKEYINSVLQDDKNTQCQNALYTFMKLKK